MKFLQPHSWSEALAAKSAHPDAVPIMGGTDIMVELNFDRRRPAALLDLSRIPDLADWTACDGRIRFGAGVTYRRLIDELGDRLPGLAMAARTIGSPQIRNRGTVAGNLGGASPAGDSHPALLAAGAEVVIASSRGRRVVPVCDFYLGVKRNVLEADELIEAVEIAEATGPQQFCKIGTRNAMVIAVSSFGLALHPVDRAVGTGIGSSAVTPRRAYAAEQFLADALEASGLWQSRAQLPDALTTEFGRRVSGAASPIDDVRGTANYRLHSLSVMARRSLTWAWHDYQKAA
ncbi:FAD binding domain-containing protein [Saxibacter everestensis]|uniref:FAD binding domain-containing protein n=1 Tax=Saxibacter everestensis TaxID=2909229 RepID=A0ABY8QQX7_9MICO|nr:FAD binding domain-containing protein [Brevibacteriaceae bacterium ZFBP1038]